MKLRVLIADAEPGVRQQVRALLAREPDAEVVGECGDGRAALELIRRERPDLVVLDADLPGTDGFGVLRALKGDDDPPLVVFQSARREHALHAWEVHALDYLVHPLEPDRFRMAFRRARAAAEERAAEGEREALQAALERLQSGAATEPGAAGGGYLERVMVRTGSRVLLLRVADVDWIGAEGNYAELHVGPRRHLIRETMAALESRLDPGQFLRVHRSTIVNLDRVRELRPWTGGDYLVVLHDGTELRLSRGYRARLERLQARIGNYT